MFLIAVYQVFIRPILGYGCKYHPNCSAYAQQAIAERGLILGSWLSARRILRCNPAALGGFDPIPMGEVKDA